MTTSPRDMEVFSLSSFSVFTTGAERGEGGEPWVLALRCVSVCVCVC